MWQGTGKARRRGVGEVAITDVREGGGSGDERREGGEK